MPETRNRWLLLLNFTGNPMKLFAQFWVDLKICGFVEAKQLLKQNCFETRRISHLSTCYVD